MASYPSTTTYVDSTQSAVALSQAGTPFLIERTYALDTLITGKLANADIVNLFTLAANHVILATYIKTTVIAVGCSSTCTLKLRFGTTDIGAATDILTLATGTGGAATVALPLTNGTSATAINLVAAIGGGTTTTNPTVKVSLLVCKMA
jgi:hypothetical protein